MFKTLKENKTLNKILLIFVTAVKGTVIYILGLCVLALIMNYIKSESGVLYYALYIFVMLGSFVCALGSCKKIHGRGFLVGLLSSIPYSLLVLLITSILSHFRLSPDILMVFILSLLGGFLGGITAVNARI